MNFIVFHCVVVVINSTNPLYVDTHLWTFTLPGQDIRLVNHEKKPTLQKYLRCIPASMIKLDGGSKGSFGPDWSPGSICCVPFALEPPSEVTLNTGIGGKHVRSATSNQQWDPEISTDLNLLNPHNSDHLLASLIVKTSWIPISLSA